MGGDLYTLITQFFFVLFLSQITCCHENCCSCPTGGGGYMYSGKI